MQIEALEAREFKECMAKNIISAVIRRRDNAPSRIFVPIDQAREIYRGEKICDGRKCAVPREAREQCKKSCLALNLHVGAESTINGRPEALQPHPIKEREQIADREDYVGQEIKRKQENN